MTGSPPINNGHSAALELELVPVDVDTLASWGDRWRRFERQLPHASAYTTFDWLYAWATVYRPRRLLVAHAVGSEEGATGALGLIEVDRIRGWRFAGGAVSPQRAPLCAAGVEAELWAALAAWLRRHPGAWSSLEASGVARTAACLPGARLSGAAVQALSLTASFEDYLASIPGRRRHEIRRRLRRTEEAGIEVREVAAAAFPSAFADFLRLSDLRRELRRNHDETLVELLHKIDGCSSVEVHVFEVVSDGSRIGVSIDLVHGEIYYPYCLAWEPDSSSVSPGILLTLNAITYSIGRGLSAINLGPGEQPYKSALGFTAQEGMNLQAVNPAAGGRAWRMLGRTYQRLRPRPTATSR